MNDTQHIRNYCVLVLLMVPLMVLVTPIIGNHSGSDSSPEPPSVKPDAEWVRRDSVESVLSRVCDIRLIKAYKLESRFGRWHAEVPTNDVSKFLGTDFKKLEKASNKEWALEVKRGKGFSFECRLQRFKGVEYVFMPLDILYALAENMSSLS